MADSYNNGDKPNKATVGDPPELPLPSSPPHADVENPSSTSTVVISSIIDRWKREDLLMKCNLVLRASALVFSFISFIVMASNKHGDWMNFDRYEEYRYCLAIAILACLYTGMQVSIKIFQFSTGRDVISTRASGYIGFVGDQIAAYLLISATSAAASLTNQMRQVSDNLFTDASADSVSDLFTDASAADASAASVSILFTDASAASVSMAFFAFAALALSAVISGFKLSHQSYI